MSRLKEILDIVSATEDSDDVLLELLKPEAMTREEAQEVYEACLGYDPTTYYDVEDIRNFINVVLESDIITEEVKSFLVAHRDDLEEHAYEYYERTRPEFVQESVASAVYEILYENGHEDIAYDFYEPIAGMNAEEYDDINNEED